MQRKVYVLAFLLGLCNYGSSSDAQELPPLPPDPPCVKVDDWGSLHNTCFNETGFPPPAPRGCNSGAPCQVPDPPLVFLNSLSTSMTSLLSPKAPSSNSQTLGPLLCTSGVKAIVYANQWYVPQQIVESANEEEAEGAYAYSAEIPCIKIYQCIGCFPGTNDLLECRANPDAAGNLYSVWTDFFNPGTPCTPAEEIEEGP